MSPAIEPGLIRRVRFTPMRDLLRGRATGGLDWRTRLASSTLPQPTESLIARVVKKTRLWLGEKRDVTDELIAHFLDGAESGASQDELIQRFGDPAKAARLIRRAKKRNRPIVWHIFKVARWCVACLIGVYVLIGIYFLLGKPTPMTNYVTTINASVVSTPESDRAWPIYRQALLALGDRDDLNKQDFYHIATFLEGKPARTQLDQWIAAHQSIVEIVHRGAAKPRLGFAIGPNGDAYDPELYPKIGKAAATDAYSRLLIALPLPHLSDINLLATMIEADASVAASQHDSARFKRDIASLVHIAGQAKADRLLVSEFVSKATRTRAFDALDKALSQSTAFLTDAHLQEIAHEISGPHQGSDLVSYETERMIFYDLVQNAYTDDGHGDGRMTLDGLRLVDMTLNFTGRKPRFDLDPNPFVASAAFPFIASRRELTNKYDAIMDIAEACLSKPSRENHAAMVEYQKQFKAIRLEPGGQLRYAFIAVMLPELPYAQWSAEISIARQQALCTAIALELYRRQTGTYPESLDALPPRMLPQVPADPIDGKPVRYRRVGGKPLLYSVGADRDDDGGRLPTHNGKPLRGPPGAFPLDPAAPTIDGDWVLYPEPRKPDDE